MPSFSSQPCHCCATGPKRSHVTRASVSLSVKWEVALTCSPGWDMGGGAFYRCQSRRRQEIAWALQTWEEKCEGSGLGLPPACRR